MLDTVAFLTALVSTDPLPSISPSPTAVVSQLTPSPPPCPSAAPHRGSSRTSEPVPCPSSSPTLKTIAQISTVGRKANLIGKSLAASEGTIDQQEIATRPLLRPGEVLEAIPGLVITQHSGEGKANQYYLRGFQLDHGTDLESTIDGIPINMPTHAHGQGYSDINWLMPELVSYVEFKKGPYYADRGDFSTAGSYSLYLRNTIESTSTFGSGDFGYDRLFTAASPQAGAGHLLYGFEIYHDNGTFAKPDEYHKVNGLLRYSIDKGANSFTATGYAYNGAWNSTDQIPQRLVDAGELNPYGYIDPTDGGNTYRYALSAHFEHRYEHGTTKLNVYGERYFLDLFSNFTYYLDSGRDYYNTTANPVTCDAAYRTCRPYPSQYHTSNYVAYCAANQSARPGAPAGSVIPRPFTFSCPDQREQKDDRVVSGFDFSHSFQTRASLTTVGIGLRNDNIATVGLYLGDARNRYPNGTLSDDHVVERASNAYIESDIKLGKFRVAPGLRGDVFNFNVHAFDPRNGGKATGALLSPKLALAYAFTSNFEAYADFGESFHSNDARGVTGVNDPFTHRNFDTSGDAVAQNAPLTRAVGEEVGFRVRQKEITTTVSGWQMLLANELVFAGDAGTTELSGPTFRKGIEVANYYTPTNWLTMDADLSTSTAIFLNNPGDQGNQVPESLNSVVALGATVDEPHYAASLRMRYFGPRTLDQSGAFKSPPSTIFNTQLTAKLNRNSRLSLDVYNIFNVEVPDTSYYYGSWLTQDAANPAYANDPAINPTLGAAVVTGASPGAQGTKGSASGGGVNDFHFHPAERRIVRLTLSARL